MSDPGSARTLPGSVPVLVRGPAVPESTPIYVGCKQCSKCQKVKPLNQFGSRGGGRVRSDCKLCVAEASRERYHSDPNVRAKHKVLRDRWRTANPTYSAEYYQANRERLIAAAVEYEKKNPVDREYRREWERSWYAATRDERRAVDRVWQANNLERVRENRRRAMSRRRARLRGLPSESYTIDQLLERDGTLCTLCGKELDLTVAYPEDFAPTVEHLECFDWPDCPGDILTNVAVSHWDCNNSRRTRPHPAAARKRAELLAAEAQLT